jgi:hypothetical protein
LQYEKDLEEKEKEEEKIKLYMAVRDVLLNNMSVGTAQTLHQMSSWHTLDRAVKLNTMESVQSIDSFRQKKMGRTKKGNAEFISKMKAEESGLAMQQNSGIKISFKEDSKRSIPTSGYKQEDVKNAMGSRMKRMYEQTVTEQNPDASMSSFSMSASTVRRRIDDLKLNQIAVKDPQNERRRFANADMYNFASLAVMSIVLACFLSQISVDEMSRMTPSQFAQDPRVKKHLDPRLEFNIDKSSTYLGADESEVIYASPDVKATLQSKHRDPNATKSGLMSEQRRSVGYTVGTSAAGALEMDVSHIHDHAYDNKPAKLYRLKSLLPMYVITNGTKNASSDADETRIVMKLAEKIMLMRRDQVEDEKEEEYTPLNVENDEGFFRSTASRRGSSRGVQGEKAAGPGSGGPSIPYEHRAPAERGEDGELLRQARDDTEDEHHEYIRLLIDGELNQTKLFLPSTDDSPSLGDMFLKLMILIVKLAAACSKTQQPMDVMRGFLLTHRYYRSTAYSQFDPALAVRPAYMDDVMNVILKDVAPASSRTFERYFLTRENVVAQNFSPAKNSSGWETSGLGAKLDVRQILSTCTTSGSFSQSQMNSLVEGVYVLAVSGLQKMNNGEGETVADEEMERVLGCILGPVKYEADDSEKTCKSSKATTDKVPNRWRATLLNSPGMTKAMGARLQAQHDLLLANIAKDEERKAAAERKSEEKSRKDEERKAAAERKSEEQSRKAEEKQVIAANVGNEGMTAPKRRSKTDKLLSCVGAGFLNCQATVLASQLSSATLAWRVCNVCRKVFCESCAMGFYALHRKRCNVDSEDEAED